MVHVPLQDKGNGIDRLLQCFHLGIVDTIEGREVAASHYVSAAVLHDFHCVSHHRSIECRIATQVLSTTLVLFCHIGPGM
jgi:hypothetical protein